ncbi:hypothetical protein ABPG75_003875 [Micractinium tetrahymenae]
MSLLVRFSPQLGVSAARLRSMLHTVLLLPCSAAEKLLLHVNAQPEAGHCRVLLRTQLRAPALAAFAAAVVDAASEVEAATGMGRDWGDLFGVLFCLPDAAMAELLGTAQKAPYLSPCDIPPSVMLHALWSAVRLLRKLPLAPPEGMPAADHVLLLCGVLRVAGKLRLLAADSALEKEEKRWAAAAAASAAGAAAGAGSRDQAATAAEEEGDGEGEGEQPLPDPLPGQQWVLQVSAELLRADAAALGAVLERHSALLVPGAPMPRVEATGPATMAGKAVVAWLGAFQVTTWAIQKLVEELKAQPPAERADPIWECLAALAAAAEPAARLAPKLPAALPLLVHPAVLQPGGLTADNIAEAAQQLAGAPGGLLEMCMWLHQLLPESRDAWVDAAAARPLRPLRLLGATLAKRLLLALPSGDAAGAERLCSQLEHCSALAADAYSAISQPEEAHLKGALCSTLTAMPLMAQALPLIRPGLTSAERAQLQAMAGLASKQLLDGCVVVRLSRRQLEPAVNLLSPEAARVLLDWRGTCALMLAAALGHTATVAALLAAGADPTPADLDGQPTWHPLAAAATADAEAAALENCRLLLAAGADVTAVLTADPPATNWRYSSCRWLLTLQSSQVERLIIEALLERCRHDGWRPGSWGMACTLLLLAAQASDQQAFLCFASALPADCPPAEYENLAEEVVGTITEMACRLASRARRTGRSGGSGGSLLPCIVRLAAGDGSLPAAPASDHSAAAAAGLNLLVPHLTAELAASLEAAAAAGNLNALQCLLSAGAAVIPAAGLEPLHPDSLEMAEVLLQAGYRPPVYHGVLVRQRGEQQARLVHTFDPAAEDPSLQVAGSGRFLWLAITRPDWSHATHGRFPPAFQRAARTLLLAAAGGAATGSALGTASNTAGAGGLARLPGHVLERILRLAAYPLSAWAQAPWDAVAAWLAACQP